MRAALVEAAERVLERAGVAGLTVRAVAAEAGVAPMGVYNHLQNKEGLLAAVLSRGFDRLAQAMAWRADLPARDAMREVGWAYRSFALEHPVGYGLMFGAGVWLPAAADQVGAHADLSFDGLVHAILASQQAGTIRRGPAQPIAMTIWAAVHGAVSIEVAGSFTDGGGDAAYSAVLDLIERGMAPDN